MFQQLVELRESGKVLRDVHPSHQQQGMDRQYSDTKDILETWRWGSARAAEAGWGGGALTWLRVVNSWGCGRVV